MRREFLILLCYVGPKFPSSLASCKLLSTAATHTPGKTNVVCLAPGIQSGCPQDAPDLTPNLFWFIQDPKDRHLPQSPAEWWHNLWCPFGFNGTGLGAPCPEAAPRAVWEQPLAEMVTAVVVGGSVSMTWPDDLSGDTAGQARSPCEFLAAKTIIQKGAMLEY